MCSRYTQPKRNLYHRHSLPLACPHSQRAHLAHYHPLKNTIFSLSPVAPLVDSCQCAAAIFCPFLQQPSAAPSSTPSIAKSLCLPPPKNRSASRFVSSPRRRL